jgi:hypothetical protein
MEQIQAQVEIQPTHEQQIEVIEVVIPTIDKNSFGYLIDRAIQIFCYERLTDTIAIEFKNNLKTIKELYGIRISKEYIKPYFNKNKATFRTRFKRICKKAELKTIPQIRYTERLSSKNGILFNQKNREILNFFDI